MRPAMPGGKGRSEEGSMEKQSLRGSLLLLLGSVIWGAAFAAQRVGMEHIGPMTFIWIRMMISTVVMLPVIRLMDSVGGGRKEKPTPEKRREQWKAGLICGTFLFVASALQQAGLVYTTAGKAGFITALCVVLVPVAGWLIFRRNPGRMIWIGVGIAVVALYLLCMSGDGFEVQTGDLLMLVCAICFTGQILSVDYYAPRVDGARLACMQFLVSGVLGILVAGVTEGFSMAGVREAMPALLYTGVMSGAAGYTLQIFGQRETNPTVASLLMCLESVFAVLTGAILLGEKMTGRETAGCILMFLAVILAQLSPVIARRRRGEPLPH